MIYRNVKKFADEKGVSIYRIEKDTGIGNGTIAKWGKVANQMPTVDNLKKVADYLAVSMDCLMQSQEEER